MSTSSDSLPESASAVPVFHGKGEYGQIVDAKPRIGLHDVAWPTGAGQVPLDSRQAASACLPSAAVHDNRQLTGGVFSDGKRLESRLSVLQSDRRPRVHSQCRRQACLGGGGLQPRIFRDAEIRMACRPVFLSNSDVASPARDGLDDPRASSDRESRPRASTDLCGWKELC